MDFLFCFKDNPYHLKNYSYFLKVNPYVPQIATYVKGGCSRLSSWTSAFGLSCTTKHGFHSFIVQNPQSGRRP